MKSIILDTDMDADCDDAAALAIANILVKRGEIKLLGVICNALTEWGGSCIETINKHYKNNDVPIGVLKIEDIKDDHITRFQKYYEHLKSLPPVILYNEHIGREVGKKACEYLSAVDVYRQILGQSEEKSVTICCIGFLTVLEQLLFSKPDKYSLLDGFQLIEQKVESIVCMANMEFPQGWESFNWRVAAESAENFVNNCPCAISVSSDGEEVLTGESLSRKLPKDNVLRRIYERYLQGESLNRPSWDQIALIYSAGISKEKFKILSGSTLTYSAADNRCDWTQLKDGRRDKYVRLKVKNEEMAEYIENLMGCENEIVRRN
ncbi:MAG: hypothetical protein WCQ41_08705 [Bacillota bacterium]